MGTYRFKPGFYSLSDMPANFQKAMYYTLIGVQNTYWFLDDIKIVSTGSETEHLALVTKCLKKLDDDNLRINLRKYHFAKTEMNGWGKNIPSWHIATAIPAIPPPSTLKRLRSFFRSVNYIGKFIPQLAQLCYPLRPLLKNSTKFIWTEEHNKHFNLIKEKIAAGTENSHYNPKSELNMMHHVLGWEQHLNKTHLKVGN